MIIFMTIIAVLCVGVWAAKSGENGLGVLLIMISTILLLLAVVTLPVSHMGTRADVKKLAAFQDTLAEIRKTDSIENAAIQIKVAEWNQWLANAQYWNQTVFGLWIPDMVDDIHPLK